MLFLHYFDHYQGNYYMAIRRVCEKFDIYYSDKLVDITNKNAQQNTKMVNYISRAQLVHFHGKTYDTTIDEEEAKIPLSPEEQIIQIVPGDDGDTIKAPEAPGEIPVPPEDVIRFWGSGLTPDWYFDLQTRYDKWTRDLPKPLSDSTEALYKQVCMCEVTINRNVAAGKPVESTQKTLQDLLGNLNAKPIQQQQVEQLDASFEDMPFGVGIKLFENYKPIPESRPEYKDVNGLIRSISTWFLGHLCKMLHIKNSYSQMYEDAINKYRVNRPELEDEDDETVFNTIFGDEAGQQ